MIVVVLVNMVVNKVKKSELENVAVAKDEEAGVDTKS